MNFGFLPGDLALFQRYNVPDDVVKAMAAKSNGKPISQGLAAPAVQVSPPQAPRVETPAAPPHSQDTLTNESLVKLVKAGMGEDTVVGIVNTQPGRYSLSTDSLIALKQAGVSDKVIAAMVNRNAKLTPVGVSGSAGTPTPPITPIVNLTTEQTANGAQRARIFITDSNSWEMSGGFAAASNRNGGGGSGGFAGGARPQTVEVIKTFGERCPGATITMDKTQAQFIVLFDHEGGKGYARKDNKLAVFRAGGDLLFSDSTRSLGNAAKDACEAIFR